MSREETARRVSIWIALYAIPALVVMRPVLDPDIWWHLRTGEWVVAHGTVPTLDPFSSYGLGRPWIAYSWLFDVLVYGLYRGLGLTGLLLYRVLLSLAVVVAVHRLVARREPRFVVATSTVALALVAIVPLLNERPWLFTVLFGTLTLDAVLDLRAGASTKAIWLLPPMYALWANVHIQFVYGLSILALACVAPLLDRFLVRGEAGEVAVTAGSWPCWSLVALTGACFAATLLNPYHGRLYAVVVEYATQVAPYRYVLELTALTFRTPWEWAVLAMVGAGAFALGRRPKRSAFEMLLLAATASFAFRSKRDAWFVVVAAAALIALPRSTDAFADRFALTRRRALLVAAAVLTLLVVVGRMRNLSEHSLASVLAEQYPVAAAAVVEERGYAGPLYNHFDWGGYLMWRLPGIPVAMDGRTNVHGDDRIERAVATWAGKKGWAFDPELAAARLVIAEVDGALASLLRLDPHFELVYEDSVAAIFIARPKPEGS